MLKALQDIYSVFWVDVRNQKHHWQALVVTSLVQPLLYLITFGYGLNGSITFDGVSYLEFIIPGIVALTAFSNSYHGAAYKLQVDRFFYRSFDELLMAPVSQYSIVLGKALIGFVRGLLSSALILAVGLVLMPTLTITSLFLLVLIVSCLVFALFGVYIAFAIDSHQAMSTFSNLVILPMTFLCGTFFSLNALPEAAKWVLYVLPLTHASQCLRAASLLQPFPWLSLLALFGFGVAFFAGSYVTLKKKSL
jgi:ABC-type multidrug transport system permease subunit